MFCCQKLDYNYGTLLMFNHPMVPETPASSYSDTDVESDREHDGVIIISNCEDEDLLRYQLIICICKCTISVDK